MADIQQDSATHEDNIILCMKWGTKYGAEYVNRLYNMVKRHLTLPFKMVCLASELRFGKVLIEKINQKGDFCKKKIANEEIMCNFVAVWKR